MSFLTHEVRSAFGVCNTPDRHAHVVRRVRSSDFGRTFRGSFRHRIPLHQCIQVGPLGENHRSSTDDAATFSHYLLARNWFHPTGSDFIPATDSFFSPTALDLTDFWRVEALTSRSASRAREAAGSSMSSCTSCSIVNGMKQTISCLPPFRNIVSCALVGQRSQGIWQRIGLVSNLKRAAAHFRKCGVTRQKTMVKGSQDC